MSSPAPVSGAAVPVVACRGLRKTYRNGPLDVPVLLGVDLDVAVGERVAIEKRVMFIILTLIVAVAAFNIVSAQVMVVTDKQADIAILRTLGAAPSSVMAIFMIQGALIGIIGTLIGVVGGVLLALNVETVVPAIERTLHIQFLDKSVYYISDLPSDLQSADVITIASIALVLALVATLYPSFRASRVNPAEALRYE